MWFGIGEKLLITIFAQSERSRTAFIPVRPVFLHEVGEVLEWFKRHAWKACIPQKGIEGSNPSLSAKPT